jgi:hypothetical protein
LEPFPNPVLVVGWCRSLGNIDVLGRACLTY